MYSSAKITDSPSREKFALHSTPKNSKDRIHQNFVTPKMTGAPVRLETYATPPKPLILSPKRYSLSDIATPPRITQSINRSNFLHNVPGPLLASTKFNVNVSTYEETKSPGLAGRIVQYNQETENFKHKIRPPTHQTKYGSPGLFPIVHLFKKSPPTLEQRPKRVKVRISSPGYTRQQSEDYKLKLLEGIVKPRPINRFSHGYSEHSGEASTSTRSVLDALKEISRKRIHTSEEYDIDTDSGKRQRTDFLNGPDTNKRARDDTPPLFDSPTSPNKPLSKRACMYDEYAASCSSTVYVTKTSDLACSKRKSTSTSTLGENPTETKQLKLINVETQTNVEVENGEIPKEREDSVEPQDIVEVNDEEPTKKEESPLRVFDDAPLERIRKNRLAALMGSLTGKNPVLAPKPTFSTILNGNSEESDSQNIQISVNKLDNTEKALVSILTTNKLLHKSDKHVHFNIPETSSSASSSDSTNLNNATNSTSNKNILTPVSISQASDNSNNVLPVVAPPSSPESLERPESNEEIVNGSKGIGSLQSIQETSVPAKSSSSNLVTPFINASSSAPQFVFNPSKVADPSTTSAPTVMLSSSFTSPTKVGGFKFDLSTAKRDFSKTATTNTSSTMSSLQPITAVMPFEKSNFTTNSLGSTIITTVTTPSTQLSFGTITTASSTRPLCSSSASPIKFGVFTSESNTKAKSTTLEVKNTVASATFAFGGTATTALTNAFTITTSSLTTVDKIPAFSFNAPKMSTTTTNTPALTPTFSFGSQKQTPIITGSLSTHTVSFGAALSNSAVIPNNTAVTNANSFGVTTSSGFGGSTPSTGLGSSITSSQIGATAPSSDLGASASSSGFGTSASSTGFGTSASSTGFGASAPSSGFGASASSGFGSSTPSFGSSTLSFGTQNANSVERSLLRSSTNATSSSCFGTSTTAVSVFGTTAVTTTATFEPSTTSSNFAAAGGFALKTSSTANGFAASNNSTRYGGFEALNKSTAGNFATTDASSTGSFCSTNPPIFGGTKSATSFGAPAVTTSSNFGNSAKITNSPFSNASVAAFGQKASIPSFGTTTTTAATPAFGSVSNSFNNATTTSSSVFGESSGFSSSLTSSANIFAGTSKTQTPGFGTSNTIFATTSTLSPFENKATTTNSFTAKPTAIFSFGAKTTTAGGTGFGSNSSSSSGFGSTVPSFGTNSTFGGNNNSSFGNANAFGSNAPTTTQPSGFGTQTSTFGAPANQGFGMENKTLFGSTHPSFGANTAAPAAPVFGSNSTSAFGASNNNSSSFAANNANTNSGFVKPQGNNFGAAVPNNFSSTTAGFGSNQTQVSFGNSNTSAGNAAPVFNFGSGTTPNKPGVFSFGGPSSSNELPKPAFNFTGGNMLQTPAPAFGAGSSFGASASSFGNAGPPQFAASSTASTNMFNIGTGAPPARNRTMIRAKRRT